MTDSVWAPNRVEVIGGPSSFLFGAGAVDASINYIAKLAERSEFSEVQLRAGSQGLKEASCGLNRRVVGDGGDGSYCFRLDVNHLGADSRTDGAGIRSTQLAASLLPDFGGGVGVPVAASLRRP